MNLKIGKGVTKALFDSDDLHALELFERKRIKQIKIEQQLKSSKSHVRTLYMIMALVILLFVVIKFQDRYWRAELDYDGSVQIVRDSWWGMKHEHQPLRFDKEEGWQFKGKNGEWYLLSLDDEDY